jgi:hypothetical protein
VPVGRGVLAVADSFPCLDLFLQHLLIGDAAVEALGGENRAFGFRQIQPTPVLGCVVLREPFNKAAGFGGGTGVVKRGRRMRVQVVLDEPNFCRAGDVPIG